MEERLVFLLILIGTFIIVHVTCVPLPEEIIEYEDELEEVYTKKPLLMKKASHTEGRGPGHSGSANGAAHHGTMSQNSHIGDVIVITPRPKGTTTGPPHVHTPVISTTYPPEVPTTTQPPPEDPEAVEVERMLGLMAGIVSSSDPDPPAGGSGTVSPLPATESPPETVTEPAEPGGEVDEDDPIALLQNLMKEHGPLAMIGGGLALILASSVGFSTKIISMLKNPNIANISDQFKKMATEGKDPKGTATPVDKLKDKLKTFTGGKGGPPGKDDVVGKLKKLLDKDKGQEKGKEKEEDVSEEQSVKKDRGQLAKEKQDRGQLAKEKQDRGQLAKEKQDRGQLAKRKQDRDKVAIEDDDPSDESNDSDPYNSRSTESPYPEVHKMAPVKSAPKERSRNVKSQREDSAEGSRAPSEFRTNPVIHNQGEGRGKPEMKRIESLVNSRAQLNNIDNLAQKEEELKQLENIVKNPAQLERLEVLVKNPAQLRSLQDLMQRENELKQVQAIAGVKPPRVNNSQRPPDPRDENSWQSGMAGRQDFQNPSIQSIPEDFPDVHEPYRQFPGESNMVTGVGSGYAQNPTSMQQSGNDMRRGSTIPNSGNPAYSQRDSPAPTQYGTEPQHMRRGSTLPMPPSGQFTNEYPSGRASPVPTHMAPPGADMRRPEYGQGNDMRRPEYGNGLQPQPTMSPRPVASGQSQMGQSQLGRAQNPEPAYRQRELPVPTQYGTDQQHNRRGSTLPMPPVGQFTNEYPSGRASPIPTNLAPPGADMSRTEYGNALPPQPLMSPRPTASGQMALQFGREQNHEPEYNQRASPLPNPDMRRTARMDASHGSQSEQIMAPRSMNFAPMSPPFGREENYGAGGYDDPLKRTLPTSGPVPFTNENQLGRPLSPSPQSMTPHGREAHMRSIAPAHTRNAALPPQPDEMEPQHGRGPKAIPPRVSSRPAVINGPAQPPFASEEPFDKDEAFADLDKILASLEQKEPYEAFDNIRKMEPNRRGADELSGNMSAVAKKLSKYPAGGPVPGQDPSPTRFPYKPTATKGQGGQGSQNGPASGPSATGFLSPPPVRLSPPPKIIVTSPPNLAVGVEMPPTGAFHRYQGPTEDEYYDDYLHSENPQVIFNGHNNNSSFDTPNTRGHVYGRVGAPSSSDYSREYNRYPQL